MSFWSNETPLKPTGIKSVESVLDYPIDFSAWLADMGAVYANHTVTHTGSITIVSSTYANGIVSVVISGGELGETTSFTVHMNAIVLGSARSDQRTFYLNIVNR
ncbi:hypothetical protein UFOVP136_31 [uncultured Caudovirales phage]|uniref:Uncharacterized protein n=1 Tax=uncultured Caudovirales phage TaxID=2100421 RepID=A0A6J5LG29_9CAUD|nr:hypothetical protein UFOVP136_31 [uncultured Caudovirales phage]